MGVKIVLLVVFFAVMAGVGLYSRKHARSVDGFVLGGRSLYLRCQYTSTDNDLVLASHTDIDYRDGGGDNRIPGKLCDEPG